MSESSAVVGEREELLPCPFCGERILLGLVADPRGRFYLECDNGECFTQGTVEAASREEAITKLNRRASLQPSSGSWDNLPRAKPHPPFFTEDDASLHPSSGEQPLISEWAVGDDGAVGTEIIVGKAKRISLEFDGQMIFWAAIDGGPVHGKIDAGTSGLYTALRTILTAEEAAE